MAGGLTLSLVGELHDLGLSDIFQILALSQRTGTLVVTTPTYVGQVLFASGLIVGGGLSTQNPTVGAHLLAQGALGPAKLAELTLAERRGTTGLALLELCGGDPSPIVAAMETMLRAAMAQLLEATQGSFSFQNAQVLHLWPHFSVLGTMALFPPGLKAQYLAMEAVRLRDEAQKGGAAIVPAADPTSAAPRPQALAQALSGKEGPQEDDWSALLSEDDGFEAVLAPAPPCAPAPEPWAATALADLRDVVRGLRRLPSGTDPSELLLRALRLHCERGAYFEVQGQKLVGRDGFGQDAGGRAVAPAIAQRQVPLVQGSAAHLAIAQAQPCLQPLAPTDAHKALLGALGGSWHNQAVLIAPWLEGGRVVGLLVGDNPSGRPLVDAPGVDILVAQASMGASAAPITRRAL